MTAGNDAAGAMRVDVWLDIACLFKTRSEAKRACEGGKVEVKTLRSRTKMIKRETEKNVLFEARDRQRGDAWIHRNYLAK